MKVVQISSYWPHIFYLDSFGSYLKLVTYFLIVIETSVSCLSL